MRRLAAGSLVLFAAAAVFVRAQAGDPSRDIADVRNVETVFRQGVGYDPQKLIQAVTGRVGLW